ncbi:MAG: LysR family transcriptional regulator [Pigmentiphaga sp.]
MTSKLSTLPPNITLRQLRAFVEVVRCAGFTAAARKLHLTQSATSLLVRELEAQLGLQLVDRTTRNVSATEAGREFLPNAERILADVDRAVSTTQELVQKRRGRVAVAITPFLASTLLPQVIALFKTSHPDIEVQILDCPVEQIMELVHNGEAHFGVGVFPQLHKELRRESLLRHSLGVMIPSHWALAAQPRSLTWADLSDQPLITLSRASGFGLLLEPLLRQAGGVKPSYEVGYLSTAVGLVEAGLGLTVIPTYVGALMSSARVRFRELRAPVVHREIEQITCHGRSLSPGAAAFLEVLASYCQRLQDE